MTYVYVVIYHDIESDEILGIYATEADARRAQAYHRSAERVRWAQIEKWPVRSAAEDDRSDYEVCDDAGRVVDAELVAERRTPEDENWRAWLRKWGGS